MKNKQSHFGFLMVIIAMITTASQPAAATPQPNGAEVTPVAPTATQMAAIPTPEPSLAALPALAPDPQEISFTAADGQVLQGYYYPAAVDDAPVVVLMHWVNGNLSDWYEIAPWLQNRGLKNPFSNPGTLTWWNPTWFPALQTDVSYNVFIFSLRNCQPFTDGCGKIDPQGWYADVQGAMLQAAALEGADATRIAAIGSSIGADSAADGCAWLNTQQTGACRGSLSLSPGNYLEISYAETVKQMGEGEHPAYAWCLGDEQEVAFCKSVGEFANYQLYEIPNGGHGNMLLSPSLEPLPMQLILDFLDAVFIE